MNWKRINIYTLESDEGYRITTRQVSEVSCCLSYSPEEKIVHKNNRLYFRAMEYKECYEVGEPVPPAYNYRTMRASLLIGGYREDDCGGVDAALKAAKDVCVLDFESQKEK